MTDLRYPLPSDGGEIRARLIAAGVIADAKPESSRTARVGVFAIDNAGIVRAAALIFSETHGSRLDAVIAQADPRIAARLRYLSDRHGIAREAA